VALPWICEIRYPVHPNTIMNSERASAEFGECQTERGGFPANFYQGPTTAIDCNGFRWGLDGEKVQEQVRQHKLEEPCADLGALTSELSRHFENLNESTENGFRQSSRCSLVTGGLAERIFLFVHRVRRPPCNRT